ncbi:MAG TPA: right-handed parallel beta-helix repeat-containing protein, partial [bacterium]|nr:right-handed parallel beta-helix repeat-containing protein [bacterium]
TAAGADTIAPNAITTISADTSVGGQITISWDTPAYSGTLGGTGLAGFHIFRANINQLTNGDTNNWYSLLIKTVSASETSWIDTTVASNTSYYYRVTAFDSHIANGKTFYNESWYSPTVQCAVVVSAPSIWYVNASTGSDTANSGSDTNSAFRTITKAMSVAASGNTIYVAAGVYAETVVFTQNNISLIGAGSNSTIITYAPSNYTIKAENKSNIKISNLCASNKYTLGYSYAIYFDGVSHSEISGCSISYSNNEMYNCGLRLNSSCSNYIHDNIFDSNSQYNINITGVSPNNTIDSNTFIRGKYGIYMPESASADSVSIINNRFELFNDFVINLYKSDTALISRNTFYNLKYHSLYLNYSSNNVVYNNYFDSSIGVAIFCNYCTGAVIDSNYVTNNRYTEGSIKLDYSDSAIIKNNRFENLAEGIYLRVGSDSCRIINNYFYNINRYAVRADNNSNNNYIYNNYCDSFASENYGIIYITSSAQNTIDSNVISRNSANGPGIKLNNGDSNIIVNNKIENTGYGILLENGSDTNYASNNKIFNSSTTGIFLEASKNNRFISNSIDSSAANGIYVFNGSDRNTFENNLLNSSGMQGLLLNSSNNNTFTRNLITGSGDYGISIQGNSSGDTFSLNNIIVSNSKYLSNTATAGYTFDLTRNYWGTIYSDSISGGLTGNASNKITYQPYRFNLIDTTVGADSIAPKAPDTVAVVLAASTGCTISWSVSNTNEIIGGALTDLAGYRVYKSLNGTSWGGVLAILDSTVLQYLDTGLTPGDYYYRVTAFDNKGIFKNESWLSDSTAQYLVAPAEIYNGPKWYVSVTAGKISGNGSETYPVLTYQSLKSKIKSGDTIYFAAGTYSETIAIDTNNITIIGADSATTLIDPPGDSSVLTLYGIYANGVNNLRISGLRITNCYNGINFALVDSSVIDNVWVEWCGKTGGSGVGIYISSGNSNTISNCYLYKNYNGILIYNSNNNSALNNICANNGYGFEISAYSKVNSVINNKIVNNTNSGLRIQQSSNNNKILNNIVSNNGGGLDGYGFYINSSSGNYFCQNDVNSNLWYGFYLTGTSTGDTFAKNNWSGSSTYPDSGIFNDCGADTIFDFRYNYWGTSDSSIIAGRVKGANSNKIIWSPFSRALNDTAIGADTIAPKAPDTVSVVSLGDTTCIISWSPSTANEENGGVLTDLSGYRIYMANSQNPVNWGNYIASVGAGVLQYQNTNILLGDTYFYKVTAFDNKAQFINESWYSDSTPYFIAGAMPVYNGPNWYTSADTGLDGVSGNGSETYPFKTISRALQAVYASAITTGETIYVYKGTYTEAVVIDTDNVSIIGADSDGVNSTIIDPAGTYFILNLYGISAVNRTNLRIANLHITSCYSGIYFNNVDTSIIENVTIDTCQNSSGGGIYIYNGSCSNLIQNCYLNRNYYGIYFNNTSNSNTVNNNKIISNTVGCYLITNSNYNIFNNNIVNSNSTRGFYLQIAVYCVFNNNTVSNNQYGFHLMNTALYNTFSANTVCSNTSSGFYLLSANNIITGNIAYSNSQHGFYITGANNLLTGNTAYSNAQRGFYITSANNTISNNAVYSNTDGFYISGSNDTITGNSAFSNSNSGLYLASSNHTIKGNRFCSNQNYGVYKNSGSGNKFEQNDFRLNGNYQIYMTGLSNDTYSANNIQPSASNHDSAVYNSSANNFAFVNNYWSTTDSSAIDSRISGSGKSYILWQPYSLSEFDTASGADTIAPDSISVISADTSAGGRITINWTTPNYIGTLGGAGLAGYNIFRAKTSELTNGDTNNWYAYKLAAVTYQSSVFVDTNVTVGETYYYRVTAFDSHYTNGALFKNESWYSPAVTGIARQYSGPIWYVNASTGSDTLNTGGDTSSAFRTITKAMSVATAGNTVYVASGTYAETVVINTNNISLIGMDSATTIIDPPGDSSIVNLYGIYMQNRNNLRISGLHITGCYYGIWFYNVDTSIIDNVKIDYCGDSQGAGFYFTNNSDSNTIRNCNGYKNLHSFYLESSSNNNLNNNTSSNNFGNGFVLTASSNYNVITNNASSNNIAGFTLNTSSNSNVISNNSSSYNSASGFELVSSSNNNLNNNSSLSNSADGYRLESSSNNNLNNNSSMNNSMRGFFLDSSNDNNLNANTSSNNNQFGFRLSSSSNNNLTNNASSNNNTHGFDVSSSSNNNFSSNKSSNNNGTGFYLYSSSNNNFITDNTSSNNTGLGFCIDSSNNYFSRNTSDSNSSFGYYLLGTSNANKFVKNNWAGSPSNPDLAVNNECDTYVDFRYNYWSTSDSGALANKMQGTYSSKILWQPFRKAPIDTAAGADTIAPKSPDTVAVV